MEAPFEPFLPEAYTAKVKGLLTGLAPTDAELQAVKADPAALAGLIDGWLTTPEAEQKLLAFFQQAFQQTQLTLPSFAEQLLAVPGFTNATEVRFLKTVRESFARTALDVMKQGRPWTEVVTTQKYMMNAPLMAYYAYADSWLLRDTGQRQNRYVVAQPALTASFGSTVTSANYAESIMTGGANYLKFKTPSTTNTGANGCMTDPLVVSGSNTMLYVFDYMHGRLRTCNPATAIVSQWTQADWDTWKMVTVRTPNGGEQPTRFFDVQALRSANEIVLTTPRAGFMTTPAFFANWPTNPSNQHRVTVNQTMIVALGRSFDDTINNNIPSIDTDTDPVDHVKPGTVCFSCHLSLDPMRQLFRQTYSFYGSEQTDPAQKNLAGAFAFDGVTLMNLSGGIQDLATNLAAHPRLPAAWVQKLCYYANSTPCLEEDPEFVRIAAAFQASGYNFRTLVRDVFSSPLVTFAARTKTFTETEPPVTISRQEHFCSAISNRLGIKDICALDAVGTLTNVQKTVSRLSLSVPSASYSRGAESPVVSRDPSLFFRAAVENICIATAAEVIDKVPAPSKYSSANASMAIDDFVQTVMALPPSHPRYAAAKQILEEHNTQAKAMGATAADALKSTFVVACSSPTSVSSGL